MSGKPIVVTMKDLEAFVEYMKLYSVDQIEFEAGALEQYLPGFAVTMGQEIVLSKEDIDKGFH